MTTTDWLIDLGLIALVIRQLRTARMDRRFFLLPLGLVGWAAKSYLTALPTTGHDLVLVAAVTTAGALLGLAAGMATKVWHADGAVLLRATPVAAVLWVLGTGTRLVFQLWATHGGGASLVHFSQVHDITSPAVYTDALILMALAEVIVRLAVIGLRGLALTETSRPVVTPERVLVSR